MSQNDKAVIKGSVLNEMQVEDLLNLDGGSVELLVDLPLLPAGFYHFSVATCEVGSTGKAGEEKAAIITSLTITGVEQLDNPADQKIVDELDLTSNPVAYKENFGLQTKDGYGIRSFCTFTAGWAEATGNSVVIDRVNNLAGAQGICKLDTNRYLPQGKADVPENYKENNRMNVRQVVWS